MRFTLAILLSIDVSGRRTAPVPVTIDLREGMKRGGLPFFVKGPGQAKVKAPARPGIYRLHVRVRDGQGHAAMANVPFEMK